jgi:hypothetical protein
LDISITFWFRVLFYVSGDFTAEEVDAVGDKGSENSRMVDV